jgi:hypothetical protein
MNPELPSRPEFIPAAERDLHDGGLSFAKFVRTQDSSTGDSSTRHFIPVGGDIPGLNQLKSLGIIVLPKDLPSHVAEYILSSEVEE